MVIVPALGSGNSQIDPARPAPATVAVTLDWDADERADDGHIGQGSHREDGPGARIDVVGQRIHIGGVVDQEIRNAVVRGDGDADDVVHFVDGHAVDQRDVGGAQRVDLLEGGAVADEGAFERRGHQPHAGRGARPAGWRPGPWSGTAMTAWLVPAWEPMSWKAMSKPLELAMICGWAEVMVKSFAQTQDRRYAP